MTKSKLTFSTLRLANITRLPLFKNSKGVIAHQKSDGSDWSLLEYAGALAGEVGELANMLKKVRRGDTTLAEVREAVAKEIADCQIYLDILAMQAGVELGGATVQKFNETSRKTGVGVFITCDDPDEGQYGDVQIQATAAPGVPSNYAAERAGFNSCDADNMIHATGSNGAGA
jgi:NTP pyrophosphatase (non-canonical NTP hydrolase)